MKTFVLMLWVLMIPGACNNDLMFVPEINKYSNTTLYTFYDEFVLSFAILSNGPTTSIIAISNSETSVMDISINECLSIIIFDLFIYTITLTPNTWSPIVISQSFINDSNIYEINVAVDETVQFSNISTHPMVLTDVFLYTFLACFNRSDCNYGSIKNLSIQSKTQVIWTQWSEWSQCNASCFISRNRSCINNQLLNCIGKSSEVGSCKYIYQEIILIENETLLLNNTLIKTLAKHTKEFSISFEIKPTEFISSWANVIHFTTNSEFNNYGHRSPALFFIPNGAGLHFCSAVNGEVNYVKDTGPLKLLDWSSIKIAQECIAGKFMYSIELNGQNVLNIENNDARDFFNVKVYVSNPWYYAQPGFIKNLKLKQRNTTSNAYWSEWSSWTVCNASHGFVNRTRECKISNSRNWCHVNNSGIIECFALWAQWSNLISCDSSNGLPSDNLVISKFRDCKYSNVIDWCHGNNVDLMEYFDKWTTWSECSVTCGLGNRSSYSQHEKIKVMKVENCYQINCPEDGMWGEWSVSECSSTCGNGIKLVYRSCNKPTPSYNGRDCIGVSNYTKVCDNDIICPINGNWSMWTSWSLCSQPCGGGLQSQFRSCSNPVPSFGGRDCSGSSEEFANCSMQNCKSVKLNLNLNFIDEKFEWYSTLTSAKYSTLRDKIQVAVSKLYSNRKVNFYVVINSMKNGP